MLHASKGVTAADMCWIRCKRSIHRRCRFRAGNLSDFLPGCMYVISSDGFAAFDLFLLLACSVVFEGTCRTVKLGTMRLKYSILWYIILCHTVLTILEYDMYHIILLSNASNPHSMRC